MSELLLLDRAGRRRSPATMPGFHTADRRGPRVSAIPPIHRRSRRSSPSCARPGTTRMGDAAWLDRGPFGAPGLRPGSAGARRRRSRSRTRRVARALGQGRTSPRSRHGRVGLGRAPAMARATSRASRRPSVLCHQRPDAWSPVVECRRPNRAAAHGRLSRASGDGSLHISSGTLTPSKWPTKAYRSSSSSASSATATSASPRSTSKASTTPRSSTRSTPAARP